MFTILGIRMHTKRDYWELMILDGTSEKALVGDVDGDGNSEIISGEKWYRPATFESGAIAEGISLRCVGAIAGDVDGDRKMEVVGAVRRDVDKKEYYTLYWYKLGEDLSEPWAKHKICPEQAGHPHDLFIVDIDGDGRNELVVVRMYIATPGVYIYKPGPDITDEWTEYVVQKGTSGDGTVAADFDGDRIAEIVAGPYFYTSPPDTPLLGPWIQSEIAMGFREMCKAALLDITGNGKPDVVIAESEYPDCRISWFENRTVEAPENPWIEHPLDEGYDFIHSIDAWYGPNGEAKIFLAEMEKGGWNNPYNYDARLVEYTSTDQGATWERKPIYKGLGAFQALVRDIDKDGAVEVVSTGGVTYGGPGIHIWKKRKKPSFPVCYRHRFLDRKKPWVGTDIMAVDVDGDGKQDVVCAAFWYRSPNWDRYRIPDISQVINSYDIDGDGRKELIATKKKRDQPDGSLSSDMYWLKPIDPLNGKWEEYHIGEATPGEGSHGWPHGTCIAPVLPDGKVAFIARGSGPLELYAMPDESHQPWPKRLFSEAQGCAPRMVPYDLTGDGLLDLVGEWKWLENLGDGTFHPHEIIKAFDEDTCPEGFRGGEFRLGDMDGDGHIDLIACEEQTHWGADPKHVSYARVAWFKNPGEPRQGLWEMHVIDTIRSPHSLVVADLDGDGELEIVCGEHDPFKPYRSRCRVYIYKKAEPQGRAWTRHLVDDRFSSHVGTQLIELEPGRTGIISHSWQGEFPYVHLWEPC